MKTIPAFGWMGPDSEDILVTNRTGATVAIGDCVMLDQRRSDADSTSQTVGLNTAGLANVINPVSTVASDLACGIFGLCMAAVTDNTKLRVRLSGYVDAGNVSGTVVLATVEQIGPQTGSRQMLILTTANTGAVAALPRKVIFIPLTARTGAGVTDGWFDGVNGFGTVLV